MHTRIPATRGDDVAELVSAAGHGDADAWSRLVEIYSGMLLARIRFLGVGPDDAPDVLQTTWLLALQNLPRLRQADRMGNWLTTIATRECIGLNRRAKEICTAELTGDAADNVADAQRAWARRNFKRILAEVVDELPDGQRELFQALTEQPRPHYVDVARRLGRPIGSIGPSRARCFGRVRMLLQDRGVTADFLD